MVNLYWSSANRDERAFDRPEDFDITRSPNDHLTFGHGGHFCLGSGIARIEIRTTFERLFARFSDVKLLGHEWIRAEGTNGLKTLRVVATPA
jgi:cytochrome P450